MRKKLIAVRIFSHYSENGFRYTGTKTVNQK